MWLRKDARLVFLVLAHPKEERHPLAKQPNSLQSLEQEEWCLYPGFKHARHTKRYVDVCRFKELACVKCMCVCEREGEKEKERGKNRGRNWERQIHLLDLGRLVLDLVSVMFLRGVHLGRCTNRCSKRQCVYLLAVNCMNCWRRKAERWDVRIESYCMTCKGQPFKKNWAVVEFLCRALIVASSAYHLVSFPVVYLSLTCMWTCQYAQCWILGILTISLWYVPLLCS